MSLKYNQNKAEKNLYEKKNKYKHFVKYMC